MGFKLRTSKRQWREKNRKGTHYEERQKSGNFLYKNEESQICFTNFALHITCKSKTAPSLSYICTFFSIVPD